MFADDANRAAAARDRNLRHALGLDAESRVVVVATEGATDPAVFHSIVGRPATGVQFE